jgi:peptide-methionine (R)-S-oxide reductase
MTREKIVKGDAEWRHTLSAEQFRVARQKGTERAFTGEYYACVDAGTYRCVCCGAELFSSDAKYDSGSGWPSFWRPVADDALELEGDASLGMRRVEVKCARCDAHLGHVFEDGPEPTGLRYCINSVSLALRKKDGA